MPSHEVSTTRRNELFSAIQEAGLDPRECEWKRPKTEKTRIGDGGDPMWVDMLVHSPTKYWFKFDVDANRNGSLWAVYKPGPTGARSSEHDGTWPNVLGYFRAWVQSVKAEHEAPDLWAALSQEQTGLGGGQQKIENTPFSIVEQAEITRQLGELKQYTHATYQLTATQYERIDTTLDYLADAAGRQGRIDWRNNVVGALIGLVLTAAIPSEPVQQILQLTLTGLAGLFRGHIPELPPVG